MTAWFDPDRAGAVAVQLPLPLPEPRQAGMPVPEGRRHRGRCAYLAGLAAESAVERAYAARGLRVAARRWRGTRAEIDLILTDGSGLVFVEVKKSRSFARAAQALGAAQRRRIAQAASEYLACMPMGLLTEARFDLAMVDGIGAVEVIENAFGEDG